MKRLLILCAMLAALLVPNLAQAAPFIYGPSGSAASFDDSKTVYDNLLSIVDASNITTLAPGAIDTGEARLYTGIGYSDKAHKAGLKVEVGNNNTVGSTTGDFIIDEEYSADEMTFRFWDYSRNKDSKKILAAILGDSSFLTEVYQVDTDVTLVLGGENFTFEAGTIFFGFAIPGGGNVTDFIMAVSPASAVPVPAAVWLLGSGMAGIAALRRKLR